MSIAGQLHQPEQDETVAVLVSDRHDNIGMDEVVRKVADEAGATAVLDAGDDTSTGETWEEFSLDSLDSAFEGYDARVAISGNHDNGTFVNRHLRSLGWTHLDGKPVTPFADVRITGVDDPRSSGLGTWRDEKGLSFDEVKNAIADDVCELDEQGERIATLLVHDANLGATALARGCTDLVLAGHVHAQIGPNSRVGTNAKAGYTYTNGTTGGAAYAIAIGSKLRRDAMFTFVTYRDGRPGRDPAGHRADDRRAVGRALHRAGSRLSAFPAPTYRWDISVTPALLTAILLVVVAACAGSDPGAVDARQDSGLETAAPRRPRRGSRLRSAPRRITSADPDTSRTGSVPSRQSAEPRRSFIDHPRTRDAGSRRRPLSRQPGRRAGDADPGRWRDGVSSRTRRRRRARVVGNYIVTGHRTSHGAPLAELPGLDVGARVLVRSGDRVFVYRVTRTRTTSFRSRRLRWRSSPPRCRAGPGVTPVRADDHVVHVCDAGGPRRRQLLGGRVRQPRAPDRQDRGTHPGPSVGLTRQVTYDCVGRRTALTVASPV